MLLTELQILEQLKQEVAATFVQHHPAYTQPITEWKGKIIVAFQEDLSERVGGYVSEKWFYTHLKATQNTKLPRIDMLQLLVQYVGGQDWQTYLAQKQTAAKKSIDKPIEKKKTEPTKKRWLVYGVASSLILLFFVVILLLAFRQKNTYQFCVIDADSGAAIMPELLEVYWLKADESPLLLSVDSSSCLVLPPTEEATIRLQIKALHYRTQIIERTLLPEQLTEKIPLQKDDYALLIHYLSTQDMEDWEQRKAVLQKILHPNLKVLQISPQTGMAVALYNKTEFVDKMTIPVNSLRNIQLLDTKYQDEQIVEIRFRHALTTKK